MTRYIVILFFLLSSSLWAADHCILDGGSGDGSAWNNAWDDLPATLTRGDTYYIGDGDYVGYTFDDAESGSTYITIKKAIESDHGTATGWSSDYGDGVADFDVDTMFVFKTGYYVTDGQVGGGPGSWASGHGFKFTKTEEGHCVDLRGGNWWRVPMPDYITFSHIEFAGRGLDTGTTDNGIHTSGQGSPGNDDGSSYITVDHCYFHHMGKFINSYQCMGWLVEYNYFFTNWSSGGVHAEGWQDFGGDHMVVRWNVFRNITGTAYIAFKRNVAGHENHDWKIYGNVFTRDDGFGSLGGNGVIGNTIENDGAIVDVKIYNNSFNNLTGHCIGIYFSATTTTGNEVYNNLWYDCYGDADYGHYTGVDTKGYNWYQDVVDNSINVDVALVAAETNGQHGVEDPFTDWENSDFTLTAATDHGNPLGSPYDEDLAGITRGYDNIWDRGAFEFSSIAVTISESGGSTDVAEEGTTEDTYTLVLSSEPTHTVTVTIDPDVDTEIDIGDGHQGEGNYDTIDFTTGDWDTPQTVTVKAIDDAFVEGTPHISTIVHTAASTDTDYDGISIPDISVNVTDDDGTGGLERRIVGRGFRSAGKQMKFGGKQ